MKKKVVILGSTGSIGISTLELAKEFKEHIEVLGLSASKNTELLEKQIKLFKPEYVAVRDEECAHKLEKKIGVRIYSGISGLEKLAGLNEADIVVIGISGSEALFPLLKAIKAAKKIALANKEALVMAGKIIMHLCKIHGAILVPVDSEQSAIFQCFKSQPRKFLNKLYITSSGGPLIDTSLKDFSKVTPEQAVRHPRWNMGKKISVDSATLVNKALEIIEARWLFDVQPENIEVVVHREAIVHSMVEFIDGSIIAQMGITNMKLPLLYALSYPERWQAPDNRLKLGSLKELHFEAPNFSKFRSLKLAYFALDKDGTMPCVLNAANEIAVDAFLNQRLLFNEIVDTVEKVMRRHKVIKNPSLDQILNADIWARMQAKELVN